jgi:O-methyltransferase
MDVPEYGPVTGQWDLRNVTDRYLGEINFRGKRVLELGPASGFLTFAMERMGAEVTAVDIDERHAWDFVPQAGLDMEAVEKRRRLGMRLLKNGFWFAHRAHRSRARVVYSNIYELPDDLGRFDVAVLGLILLHLRDPLTALERCARHADTIVVTELLMPLAAPGVPTAQLVPTAQNGVWDTWWYFTPAYIVEFLRVLGFTTIDTSTHAGICNGASHPLFTVVASRR